MTSTKKSLAIAGAIVAVTAVAGGVAAAGVIHTSATYGPGVQFYTVQEWVSDSATVVGWAYCELGDAVVGGGFEWVNAPAGDSVLTSRPTQSPGNPDGWYVVAQAPTATGNNTLNVYAICVRTAPS